MTIKPILNFRLSRIADEPNGHFYTSRFRLFARPRRINDDDTAQNSCCVAITRIVWVYCFHVMFGLSRKK